MSNDMNKTVRQFYKAVEGVKTKKSGGYDTQATVRRIEDGVAWVHIPDGVDETPARMTISAKVGDVVQVRIVNGRAFLVGNASAPPTDNTEAVKAMGQAGLAAEAASIARQKADEAVADAATAHEAAMSAQDSADIAQAAADAAQEDATIAKDAADTAKESADQALWGLSTVEDVVGTLNWITAHGTMTLTSDTAINPAHVYFVVDADGDYEVGGTHYSIVTEPKVEELSTYYELTIDESLQNYVGAHLALTSEGLWVLPAASGYKVLIATGQGMTYTEAGTYIIDGNGSTVAKFGAETSIRTTDGTELAHFGYGLTQGASSTTTAPYYTLGSRATTTDEYNASSTYALGDLCIYNNALWACRVEISIPEAFTPAHWAYAIGQYSTVEGEQNTAALYSAHAEGVNTSALGYAGHSEGEETIAAGYASHAEGRGSIAKSTASHASGLGTIANGKSQTTIGEYNIEDNGTGPNVRGTYAFIIGNGTSKNARSNAMTVDWNGNILAASAITFKTGTVTLPSGTGGQTNTTISISDIVPSGYTAYSAMVKLNSYPLPYVAASGRTWLAVLDNTHIEIANTTTAWNNYTYYITLFCRKN